MGRLLDEFIKRHNLSDTAALSLLGIGCLSLLHDDDIPIEVRVRTEELEQDVHSIIDDANSIIFSMRGGFTLDPTFKDRE